MFCRKCGCRVQDDSDFCPKCGEKLADESIDAKNEKLSAIGAESSNSEKKSAGWVAPALVVCAIAYVILKLAGCMDVPGENTSSRSTPSVQTVSVKKEPPPYTLEDALKELSWYENRLSEYVKMKSMDFATAIKAAGEMKIMWTEIQAVYDKKHNEEQVRNAYLKLQKELPKAQKNIFPKIRKAWVKGITEDMARKNVRISCRNTSCNEINLKSPEFLSIAVVQTVMDSFDSDFNKLRVKKIWFHDTFGSGTNVTRQDVSDGALE